MLKCAFGSNIIMRNNFLQKFALKSCFVYY